MSTWGAKSVKILQFPICRVAIRDLRGLPGAGGGKPSGATVGKNLRAPGWGKTFGRQSSEEPSDAGKGKTFVHRGGNHTNTKPIPNQYQALLRKVLASLANRLNLLRGRLWNRNLACLIHMHCLQPRMKNTQL